MNARFVVAAAPLFALSACGGKPESAAMPAADSAAVAPVVADSMNVPVADSGVKAPVADTGKKAMDSVAAPATKTATPKVETGDYDKAIRPRFRVDEKTGKIDTIKKP